MNKTLSFEEYSSLIDNLITKMYDWRDHYDAVIGIATGGTYIAEQMSKRLDLPLHLIRISFYDDKDQREEPIIDLSSIENKQFNKVLLVDDLIDSGMTIATAEEEMPCDFDVAVLYKCPTYCDRLCFYSELKPDAWIHFPTIIKGEMVKCQD
jgi:hypoxanthine phosphoribosyltransferase